MPDWNTLQYPFRRQPGGSGAVSGVRGLSENNPPWEESDPPGESETPEESGGPGESEIPEESETPGESEAPEESETPGESEAPEENETLGESEAPEESETPRESEAPEESETPGESEAPGNTEGPVSSDEPVESAAVDPGTASPVLVDLMLWPWIGAVAALAAALIVTWVVTAVRGRKRKKANQIHTAAPAEGPRTAQPVRPVPPGAVPQVGKLHQQGTRASQQDCFSVSPAEFAPGYGLLAVVADGMGGLTDGDKVSQTAVAAMMNSFFTIQGQPEQVLLALLSLANSEVNRLLGPGGLGKSGSTLVAGLVRDGKFYMLSVGDSRVCLYRNGTLYQLNREHIFLHELEQRAVNGEDSFQTAYNHPKGAGLTSFLGMGRLKYVDMPAAPIDIQAGDRFLLMSDGVYNALTQAELTACLGGSAEEAAALLDQAIRAKNYSNQDNYTAVILGY